MTTTETLIREIRAAAERRIDAIRNTGDMHTGWRLIRVIRTLRAEVVDDTSVAVTVANTRDGRLFSHLASEILDSASDRAQTPIGRIDENGPTSYVLSWAA